jgi:retinol dehydrogenase-12
MSAKPLLPPDLSLKGRLAVVTGSNTGIGKVTARELARAGATVVMACRSREKAEAAIADIRAAVPEARVQFHSLDLASLSNAHASGRALTEGPRIDLLVNNAGLAGSKGQTADGFELAFGTNHLGTFAFTHALLDHLVDGGRVVTVASRAHYRALSIDWNAVRQPTATATGLDEYAVSKLANVLFSAHLAPRLSLRGIDTYSLHPGVVASDIWRSLPRPVAWAAGLFMLSNDDGARTSLHCAASQTVAGQTGLYWDTCAPRRPSRAAQDTALAAELWDRSESWLRAKA